MPAHKIRTVRVEDQVWENAQAVAAANHTTVSAMINHYLQGLKPWTNFTPPDRKKKAATLPKVALPRERRDPTDCPHETTRVAPFPKGTYCVECGTKVAS